MLHILTIGALAIGVLGGTVMPAAAEQASDTCSDAKTIEIQPIGGWQVGSEQVRPEEEGAPVDGALVLARAGQDTVLMMACHGGKASYALFDETMRLPSGQPVELDIRIDQRPAVQVSGNATGKDGQIDLVASAALVDTLSNAKSFAITLRSGRVTKVYTFATAQDPEALVAWCRLCGIKR
ncbi:hypothetical protein [Reyranella soli]|uniref:Uncharacterized protein n=1 Tax=Reyranella soli TaxID=1230389 RepID=A0A512NKR6_9HYPH|nr:hypothetical protein [Reyranella soli]GEP59540.1 hypothetical protein RSO01_67060 [Reyranella soli]